MNEFWLERSRGKAERVRLCEHLTGMEQSERIVEWSANDANCQ